MTSEPDAGAGSTASTDGADSTEIAPKRGPISRIVRNKRFVKLVGAIILLALLYYAFFVVLPSQIDWDEVWAAITALTWEQLVVLGLAGVLVMVLLGWAAKASLPGLRLYQGFESSATGQMTAFVIPPPGDYVIRFSMYRTYGFTDEQSATSVLIAMVLRYLAIFFMPIVGLAAILLAGQGTTDSLWWFLGYTAAFFAVAYLIRRIIISDVTAHAVGRWTNSLVTWTMKRFHRTPSKDIEQIVIDFGQKTRGTAEVESVVPARLEPGVGTGQCPGPGALPALQRPGQLRGLPGCRAPGQRTRDGPQRPAGPGPQRVDRPAAVVHPRHHERDPAVAADGRPHAVPGGHVDHAHADRLRDVLRLALPGSQGHRDHGQP